MADILSSINAINTLAELAGLFNVQMVNGSFTSVGANGQSEQTVSFHVVNNLQIPIERYLSGGINTYNLIAGGGGADPNTGLFNTNLLMNGLEEEITRKFVLNRAPYTNYDQLADLGVGGQKIELYAVFAGTMYQTAMRNLVQILFYNQTGNGLGILTHPFYNEIKNVLPVRFRTIYDYQKMNFMVCQITFLTSDISHLTTNLVPSNLAAISAWYIGMQNAVTSIGGAISAAQSAGSGVINQL